MKRVRSAAVVALTLLLGVGCSSASKAPPSSHVAPPAPAEVTTIKVALPKAGGLVLTELLIPAFEAKHKEYKIEAVQYQEAQQLKDAFKTGQLDVIPKGWFTDGEMLLFALPLDSYLAKASRNETPYGDLIDAFRRSGQTYELPYRANISVFLYNVEMAKAAGVSIPADQWTWDEFRAALAKLGQNAGLQVRGLDTSGQHILAELWVEGHAGRPVWEADLATMRQGIGFVYTMVYTDKSLAPPLGWERENTFEVFGPTLDSLTSGQAAMVFERKVDVKTLPTALDGLHWDVAPMPSAPGAKPIIPVTVETLSIARDSRRPDAAWAFIDFVTGAEGAATLARAGYTPAYRTEEIQRAWTENRQGYPPGLDSIWSAVWRAADSQAFSPPAAGPTAFERRTEFMKAQNRALSGRTSVDEALTWFVAAQGGP